MDGLLVYLWEWDWVFVLLWMGLCVVAYAINAQGVRLYEGGAKEHFLIKPGRYSDEVSQKWWFSSAFLVHLVSIPLLIGIFHFLTHGGTYRSLPFRMGAYETLIGALSCPLIWGIVRQLRQNYVLAQSKGMSGQISYDDSLTERIVAIEDALAAGLFLIIFLLSGRYFFLGGAFYSLILSRQAFQVAKKLEKIQPNEEQAS